MVTELKGIDYGISVVEQELSILDYHMKSVRNNYKFDNIFVIDKTESGVVLPDVTIIKMDHFFREGYNGVLSSLNHFDHAHSWDYLVKNCGEHKWIVLSHIDLVYLNEHALSCIPISDDIGMVGGRTVCAVNREAYKQCFIGFSPYYTLSLSKIEGTYQLRYCDDYRFAFEKEKEVLSGMDTSEFLQIEMQILGYKVFLLPIEASNNIFHVDNGSFHCPTAMEITKKRIEEMKGLIEWK